LSGGAVHSMEGHNMKEGPVYPAVLSSAHTRPVV